MAITELALLHLSSSVSLNDTDLRSKLACAKTVMQQYTGRTFYYLQQIEDPTYVYIVGEWESLDQHFNNFIPGPDNQAVLESLKGLLTVDWLLHIDVPHADLFLPKVSSEEQKSDQGELVYGIVRHQIKTGKRANFQEAFEAQKHHLQEFVTKGEIRGGWRIDKEDDREEYVLLTPWTSVEQHQEFAGPDAFLEYGRIREYIDAASIKHGRIVDI